MRLSFFSFCRRICSRSCSWNRGSWFVRMTNYIAVFLLIALVTSKKKKRVRHRRVHHALQLEDTIKDPEEQRRQIIIAEQIKHLGHKPYGDLDPEEEIRFVTDGIKRREITGTSVPFMSAFVEVYAESSATKAPDVDVPAQIYAHLRKGLVEEDTLTDRFRELRILMAKGGRAAAGTHFDYKGTRVLYLALKLVQLFNLHDYQPVFCSFYLIKGPKDHTVLKGQLTAFISSLTAGWPHSDEVAMSVMDYFKSKDKLRPLDLIRLESLASSSEEEVPTEVAQILRLLTWFSLLDADSSGTLTAEELAQVPVMSRHWSELITGEGLTMPEWISLTVLADSLMCRDKDPMSTLTPNWRLVLGEGDAISAAWCRNPMLPVTLPPLVAKGRLLRVIASTSTSVESKGQGTVAIFHIQGYVKWLISTDPWSYIGVNSNPNVRGVRAEVLNRLFTRPAAHSPRGRRKVTDLAEDVVEVLAKRSSSKPLLVSADDWPPVQMSMLLMSTEESLKAAYALLSLGTTQLVLDDGESERGLEQREVLDEETELGKVVAQRSEIADVGPIISTFKKTLFNLKDNKLEGTTPLAEYLGTYFKLQPTVSTASGSMEVVADGRLKLIAASMNLPNEEADSAGLSRFAQVVLVTAEMRVTPPTCRGPLLTMAEVLFGETSDKTVPLVSWALFVQRLSPIDSRDISPMSFNYARGLKAPSYPKAGEEGAATTEGINEYQMVQFEQLSDMVGITLPAEVLRTTRLLRMALWFANLDRDLDGSISYHELKGRLGEEGAAFIMELYGTGPTKVCLGI